MASGNRKRSVVDGGSPGFVIVSKLPDLILKQNHNPVARAGLTKVKVVRLSNLPKSEPRSSLSRSAKRQHKTRCLQRKLRIQWLQPRPRSDARPINIRIP